MQLLKIKAWSRCIWTKGCMLDNGASMTTYPWWKEIVMAYYYYKLRLARGQWMNYGCPPIEFMEGINSILLTIWVVFEVSCANPIVVGTSNPRGIWNIAWPLGLIFLPTFIFFHILFYLLAFSCLFVSFHCCCSHVPVFWTSLVHEFHISYSLW